MDQALKTLFDEGLARFNAEHADHAQWLARQGSREPWSPSLYQTICELGWLALLQAEDGEPTPGLSDLLPLAFAAGRGLWREPVLAQAGGCAALLKGASHREAGSLLADMINGKRVFAFADSERAGLPKQAPRAHRAGGEITLTGEIALLPGGAGANAFLVVGCFPQGQPVVCLVEAGAAHLQLSPVTTVDGRQALRLELNEVTAELLCDDVSILALARQRDRLLAAAELVGIMQRVNADVAVHLCDRKQFGQPLARFQALQHRYVDMSMQARESQALVEAAADALDRGSPSAERRLLQAWAQAVAAARHVTREGIQMHGGMGVTRETAVGHCYCRVLMLESLMGSSDWALARLAANSSKRGDKPCE